MYEFILLKYRIIALKNHIADSIRNGKIRFFFSIVFFFIIFFVIYEFFKITYRFFAGFENLQFNVWFSNTILNGIFFFNFIFIGISAAILSYNLMYKDKSNLILFYSKASLRAIFIEKFVRTSILSSWSFLVLSLPLLLVQFEQYKIPIFSYSTPSCAGLILLFLTIPNALGIGIGLFLPVFFTAQTIVKFILFVLVVMVFSLLPYINVFGTGWSSLYSEIWIVQTLRKFAFLEHPLLPTYWITTSLNGFFTKTFREDSTYILVTTALVLLVWIYIIFKAFFKSMLMLATRYIHDKNPIIETLVSLIKGIVNLLTSKRRAVFLKDFAIFLRDGRFWGQLLLFVGIFSVYYMNLSHEEFKENIRWAWGPRIKWDELILNLNIIATAFMSSALAGRALYPQFSIEYSKVWINQYSKHSIEKVMSSKMLTIGTFIILTCLSLIITSSIILKASFSNTLYSCVVCLLYTYTIANMALKLGIIFHNKRTDNPVIVFSGPGGVIYIMCGTFFIVINAILMLKIGLFTNLRYAWLAIFILENALINRILNNLTRHIYKNLEYT